METASTRYMTGDMVSNRMSNRYTAMRRMPIEDVTHNVPNGAKFSIAREWLFVAAIDMSYESGKGTYDALREINGRLPCGPIPEALLDDMFTATEATTTRMRRMDRRKVKGWLAQRVTRWWPQHVEYLASGDIKVSSLAINDKETTMQHTNGTDLKALESRFKQALVADDVAAMQAVDDDAQALLAQEKRAIEDAAVEHAAVTGRWERKVKAALAMMEA